MVTAHSVNSALSPVLVPQVSLRMDAVTFSPNLPICCGNRRTHAAVLLPDSLSRVLDAQQLYIIICLQ